MLELNNVEKALKDNGEIVVCTTGTSMYPMLRHRKDMSVISAVKGELHKNDVALYRSKNGKLILHRILKVTPDIYVIRGDNLYKNEYVEKREVLGFLKSFNRNGRHVDCQKSRGYKWYIFYVKFSYPFRYVVFGLVRLIFIKIRSFIKGR